MIKNFCLVTLATVFVGCSVAPITKMPQLPTNEIIEYQLGVGDRIAVNVWKAPELSIDVPVRPDGKVSVPLIGDVQAAGVSPSVMSAKVEEALSKYVRNPQVAVVVLDPASAEFLRRVRVTGAVSQPLSIGHQQGMTVLDLVLQAGGITEFAQGNQAKLYRKLGDKVEVYPIHLDEILNKGNLQSNYLLAPSDIIAIPERVF